MQACWNSVLLNKRIITIKVFDWNLLHYLKRKPKFTKTLISSKVFNHGCHLARSYKWYLCHAFNNKIYIRDSFYYSPGKQTSRDNKTFYSTPAFDKSLPDFTPFTSLKGSRWVWLVNMGCFSLLARVFRGPGLLSISYFTIPSITL